MPFPWKYTVFKSVQSEKAYGSIEVTFCGIVTELRLLQ